MKKLRELDYSQSFAMHTMHPKRVLGNDDMNKSLKDLELAPTATILVIPVILFDKKTHAWRKSKILIYLRVQQVLFKTHCKQMVL